MKSPGRFFLSLLWGLASASTAVFAIDGNAMKPPMGWNTWEGIGPTFVGADLKKAADTMAARLKQYGYEYIVADRGWEGSETSLDAYGRFIPAGRGFDTEVAGSLKGLADYCHNRGLKFGIWGIRGVPRAAYTQSLPIKGTTYTAKDIGDITSTCPWNSFNYGIKWTHPGAQAYINSVVELYASWGIDLIKIDDLLTKNTAEVYHKYDVAGYRTAIRNSGKPMVYSLSPGNSMTVDYAPHAIQNVDFFRTAGDLWDYWSSTSKSSISMMFQKASDYNQFTGPGHWADLDMLPIGTLRTGPSMLTDTEQQTAMSLWCIFRSPIILGHDIRSLNPQIMRIIANEEVIAVNQNSTNSQKIFDQDNLVIWTSDVPGTGTPITKNVAFFNLGPSTATMSVTLSQLGYSGPCRVRDLWAKAALPDVTTSFSASIPSHGSGMYKISPVSVSVAENTTSPVQSSEVMKVLMGKTQLTISYSVPFNGPVSIGLYTLRGVLVRTIVHEHKNAGNYTTVLNFGTGLSSTSLRCVLVAKIGRQTFSKKVVIVK